MQQTVGPDPTPGNAQKAMAIVLCAVLAGNARQEEVQMGRAGAVLLHDCVHLPAVPQHVVAPTWLASQHCVDPVGDPSQSHDQIATMGRKKMVVG